LNVPPPRELADVLMSRAWDDDTPDRDRLLMEQAALTITDLLARLAVADAQSNTVGMVPAGNRTGGAHERV